MGNLVLKTARALGARTAAAAIAALSIAAAADAAPINLASHGLNLGAEWLGTGELSVAANATSASGDAVIGTILVTAIATAPFGTDSFTLTLTDLFDFSNSLDATSVAAGYADDGSFADLLFTTTAASGSLAGKSASLYAVLDLPAGVLEDFQRDGKVAFTTTARLYETSELVAPAPVPLPAAGFLLLGALAGTGVFARRRR